MQSVFPHSILYSALCLFLKTVLMTAPAVNGGLRPWLLLLSLDFCEHHKAEAIL